MVVSETEPDLRIEDSDDFNYAIRSRYPLFHGIQEQLAFRYYADEVALSESSKPVEGWPIDQLRDNYWFINQTLPGEEQLLWNLLNDNKTVKQVIWCANFRLVESVAIKTYVKLNKNTRASLQFADLVTFGNLGLNRAIEKFDLKRNLKFSTYAVWWIRQAVTNGVLEEGNTFTIPAYIIEYHRVFNREKDALTTSMMRMPSSSEERKLLVGHTEEVQQAIMNFNNFASPASIDSLVREDDDGTLADTLASDDDVEQIFERNVRRKILDEFFARFLDTLSSRERRVIALKYGLGKKTDSMSNQDIGNVMKVSSERVRQILVKVEDQLKAASKSGRLAAILDREDARNARSPV